MTLKNIIRMVLNHETAIQNLSGRKTTERAENANLTAKIADAKSDTNTEDINVLSEALEDLLTGGESDD